MDLGLRDAELLVAVVVFKLIIISTFPSSLPIRDRQCAYQVVPFIGSKHLIFRVFRRLLRNHHHLRLAQLQLQLRLPLALPPDRRNTFSWVWREW